MRRPDDLLVCEATFTGFVLKLGPPRLVRSDADAFIVIDFPPQSFGEEAFLESAGQKFQATTTEGTEVSSDPLYPKKNVPGGDETPPANLPSARVRMAGPSRVAVSMPTSLTTIGFDIASLLQALRELADAAGRPCGGRPRHRPAGLVGGRACRRPGVVLTGVPPVAAPASPAPVPAPAPAPSASASGVLGATTLVDHASAAEIAAFAEKNAPHAPAGTVTALELPYRVITSPLAPRAGSTRSRPSCTARAPSCGTRGSARASRPSARMPPAASARCGRPTIGRRSASTN